MYSANRFLTMAEMTVNAKYIVNYLLKKGWTLNAICGMLGNMQTESKINPGIWQDLDYGDTSGGFGLVQWTPATKYFNWCTANNLSYAAIDSNLKRILYEVTEEIQWGYDSEDNPPPYDFYSFTQSVEPAYLLGLNFLRYYERTEVYDQPIRGTQAQTWYDTLVGDLPTEKSNKMSKLLFYTRRRVIH